MEQVSDPTMHMTANNAPRMEAILKLSHELGREDRQLAILGEGNTSTRIDENSFLVKASGSSLGTLTAAQVTACHIRPLLALLDKKRISDKQADQALLDARLADADRKPSVEALFHAYLLTLPGVNFVGHTHPVTINQILCSYRAGEFANGRLFPDEIVCCGEYSVLVPYTDPGLQLARVIRNRVEIYRRANQGAAPRLILLCNHGMIALGPTPEAVMATTLMASKAAAIFVGASAINGPHSLSKKQVARISGRPDEHHRRKILGL